MAKKFIVQIERRFFFVRGKIIFVESVRHEFFKSCAVVFGQVQLAFALPRAKVVLDKLRMNFFAQVFFVGQIVESLGEQDGGRESLLPVNDYELLKISCGGLVLIDERADEMFHVLLGDKFHVIKKLLAIFCFPIVVALIDGNDKHPPVRDEFADSHDVCLHSTSSPKKFFAASLNVESVLVKKIFPQEKFSRDFLSAEENHSASRGVRALR